MTRLLFCSIVSLLMSVCAFTTSASVNNGKQDSKEQKVMVRGYLYDEEYNSVDSANISLSQGDSVNVSFRLLSAHADSTMLTGNELRFLFNANVGSDYTLIIDKEGFEPLVRNFKVASRSQDLIYLNTLQLKKERFRELDEVTVTATRIKMVMKGDTVVFDAGAFNLAEGSMLEELVRQLPGAVLSPEGVITYNGRKINELLVNGKDFFKGNPKVALQNLPSYTVKNLKIYDKSADDEYLTHAKARLSDDELSKNLVLDVQLKKEYMTGWMANAEAGYGTRDRYLGRAFLLGYTDRLRIAGFFNLNNIGNTNNANTSGEWSGGWLQNGLLNMKMGGIDYSYNNSDKVRLEGNITLTHEDKDNRTVTSATDFYPDKNLYRRNASTSTTRANHLTTNHMLNISAENLYLYISPSVDWQRQDISTMSRSATFNALPNESYRAQALDSLFTVNPALASQAYTRNLLTRMLNMSVSDPENLNASIYANTTFSPKSWKGRINMLASGYYVANNYDSRAIFDQNFGQANTSVAIPEKTDRFSKVRNTSRSISSQVSYNRSNRHFGERKTNTLNFQSMVYIAHSDATGNTGMFSTDSIPPLAVAPSLTCPEAAVADLANTFYSATANNTLNVRGAVDFQHEPTAPSDSGINLSFNVMATIEYSHRHDRLDYSKPDVTRQLLTRNSDFLQPRIYTFIQSANKQRQIIFSFDYSLRHSAPDLNYYLADRASVNSPLHVYIPADGSLANSLTHSINLGFYRYTLGSRYTNLNASVGWDVTRNSIANTMTYNPMTGVTTYRPANISGNWNLNSNVNYNRSLGSHQEWSFSASLRGNLTNSVDYLTLQTDPERNSVLNIIITPILSGEYKFRSGSIITAGFSATGTHLAGQRTADVNRTYWNYNPSLGGSLKLPAGFELISRITLTMRRGFDDASMNTDEWLWNATLTKSLMKGSMTLKLTATDILQSVKQIRTVVNAQGRQEIWQNSLPRYVMLSCAYRFDMKPKSQRN